MSFSGASTIKSVFLRRKKKKKKKKGGGGLLFISVKVFLCFFFNLENDHTYPLFHVSGKTGIRPTYHAV